MFSKTRLGLAASAVSLGLVATTSPAGAALPTWTTAPTVHPSTHAVRVVNLRFATHPRFDRVVLDLRGRRPGYRISYVRRLFFDPSGKPVNLRGRKKVSLVLKPAFANNYRGPRRATPDFPTLRGIAFTGNFEGVVSFGFGTSRRAPYRIFTLHNPSRLVIDFKH